MLNNAEAPYSRQLSEIAERAIAEWSIVGSISERDLADRRVQYIAAYVLIRVGNTVAQHSRQLERIYPDYRWTFWVDLRNNLAHELRDVDVGRVWRALSQWLPELLAAINGELPDAPSRRGALP